MAEGMNLSPSFIMLWGHLDLRAAHLKGSTSPLSASQTRTVALGSPGRWGHGSLEHAGCRLGSVSLAKPDDQRAVPRPGRTTAPVGPCAPPPPFPPLAVIACLLSAGSRTRLAREGLLLRGKGALRVAAALGGGGGGAAGPLPPRPGRAGGVPNGALAIKKRQQDVVRFLEANRIEFEEVDITMSEEKRQWMYKNIPEDRQPAQGNPLPPQIFSDDRYCGDYDGFFESKESNTVFSFLGLKPTLASKESEP
ncbi:PREDICTED: SH3 domain-binding glutamic acid-rich-like protein 2 [Nipponia nippon]|uniref:SH3 domain-binding glutamic acid-rich-like protein 2 n=1 Tax=Nipponia nippon TaxID=128390 RepID=UPI00051195C5|nr:PREDICTED: SH3 domain-binding glutamic acid-rich-like protein 2 [Nipponia nippon]